jgi:hypothetical protein
MVADLLVCYSPAASGLRAPRFGEDPELTFAYVGRDVGHFPVYLARWGPDQVPGGIPESDGWHHMEIRGVGAHVSCASRCTL